MAVTLPTEARVVVIGGGIMGCSTAYHLAKAGVADVVVLEREQLTSGTTWHSAAQVRQLRSSAGLTQLIRNSVALYESLEAETGLATGWLRKGSLSIATTADRLTHIRRQAALARLFGVAAEEVDAVEAKRLWPLLNTDDVIGAVHSTDDGRVNPSDLCAALVRGAKQAGATIFEHTAVSGFEQRGGRVSAVLTEHGRIACDSVALCAGLWSREVAEMVGVTAPLYACEHFYMLTEPIDGVDGHLPTLGDHDGHLYFRDEVGGLLVGCFEPNAKPLPMEKLPKGFAFDLLNEDWEHFEPMMINAMHRIPALETATVRMLLNGPESFTPDGQFLLGESPDLRGFFLGCGMNSVGLASGGGAGRALAEWIIEGRPTIDLGEVDVRRFAPFQNNLKALHERIPEELGRHYAVSYPAHHPETVRGVRRSPLHQRLASHGARFGVRAGWERPDYFVPEGAVVAHALSFAKPPWFDVVAAEQRAARQGVVLVDQSSFAKFRLDGPGALPLLQHLCANEMDVAPGRVVYTAMLNEAGGFESDLTVFRLAEEQFMLITGTAQATRDENWIRGHMDDATPAVLVDVTSGFAVIGVAGPNAAALMARVSPDDLSETAIPAYRHREIDVGYARVRAARLSYTGEPGWELYVPTEFAVGVYDALFAAGADFGLRNIGTMTLTCLRVERGFLAWGHDLTPGDTPLEAGLGFAVRFDKAVEFIGRRALLEQRRIGVRRRLASFRLDDPAAYPIGGEPIVHHGRPVGQVTTAAYGHSVGAAVCIGYIGDGVSPAVEMIAAGGFAIDIAGTAWPATARLSGRVAAG